MIKWSDHCVLLRGRVLMHRIVLSFPACMHHRLPALPLTRCFGRTYWWCLLCRNEQWCPRPAGLYLRRMHPNQMWWRPAPMNASGRLPLSKFLASSYVPVTGHACSLVHVLHTRLNCVHDSTHGRVDCGPLRRATPIQNVQSFEYPPVHTHPSNKEAEAWD